MSAIQEITNLFASLALNLKAGKQVSADEDHSIDLSITNVNKSLNLSQNSRVRVLDTALSLMCFTAPQVFDSVIEYSVKTIVAVLSSSINCKVIVSDEEAILSIGGSISSHDIVELVDVCVDIINKLKERGVPQELPGILCDSLLYAVLRVAVSASCFRHVRELGLILDVRPGGAAGKILGFSKLLHHLPKEICLKNHEIPLRLMFWFLDPLVMKMDVTHILQESIKRPFLCLDTELCERIEWRCTLLSLAFCPLMFAETRSLLHTWFLLTGLASILELQIKLVSMVIDIISGPSRWGISTELSLSLPFSHAYFPYNHQFMTILAGPLTCGGFLQLVHIINKSILTNERWYTNQAATKYSLVDHKSMWAMAMNFLDWFYYSCALLFLTKKFQDNFPSTCIIKAAMAQHAEEAEPLCSAAARYISWILNPIGKHHQDALAQDLTRIAGYFTSKHYGLDKRTKSMNMNIKKLKRPKISHDVDGKEYDCEMVRLWIEDFHDVYSKYIHSNVNSSVDVKTTSLVKGKDFLFRRISLGILIGCFNIINEEGCEVLLHYAATGIILKSTHTHDTGFKHQKRNSQWMEDSVIWTEDSHTMEAEKGACLVFYITDVVENMSVTLCDSEESEGDFICQVKSKAIKYLLKCVHRLLHINVHKDHVVMLKDLRNKLIRWRHQGKDVYNGSRDVGDTIETISKTLSSL